MTLIFLCSAVVFFTLFRQEENASNNQIISTGILQFLENTKSITELPRHQEELPEPTDVISEHNSPEPTNVVSEKNSQKPKEDLPVLAELKGTALKGAALISEGALDMIYYMQTDERWAEEYYGGTDTIEEFACGPTAMSMVVSSLTEIQVDPVQMSAWASKHGYWYPESGSLHSVIPDTAKTFGLEVKGYENTPGIDKIIRKELKKERLVVVLMGKGHFTQGGHFIILRGIAEDGKILVADPSSEERTNKSWDLSLIITEARSWANNGGPFWSIGVKDN